MDVRNTLIILWQKKRFILGIPLLACLIYLLLMPKVFPKYQSTATLMIKNSAYVPWMTPEDRASADKELMETCIQLLNTVVLQEVNNTLLNRWKLEDLHRAVNIESIPASTLVQVSASTADPKISADIVNKAVEFLPVITTKTIPYAQVMIIERGKIPTRSYRPQFFFTLIMVIFLSFLWVFNFLTFSISRR